MIKECDRVKKFNIILFSLVFLVLFAGCGTKAEESVSQTAQIGNPWSSWSSVAEAEQAVGFSFGFPDVIADNYAVEAFRTMNNELLEAIYRDGDSEIRVRKQKGEGQDISGDYNTYEFCDEQNTNGGIVTSWYNSDNNAVKQIVSYQGYSWSFVASDGWWGENNSEFLHCVWESVA